MIDRDLCEKKRQPRQAFRVSLVENENSLPRQQIVFHYPQLSEINSLRLAYGEPPPSKRKAISGSLFEGAVSEAD